MGRLAIRNVRAKPSRFVATMLAVIVGTAFLSGALVLRESLSSSLESNAEKQVVSVDAAIQAKPVEFGGPGGSAEDQGLGVPQSMLPKVEQAQGVAGASGIATGRVEIMDAAGKPARAGSVGRAWITYPPLNPFQVTAGQAPARSGEIAVDEESAGQLGLGVGSDVALRTTSGRQQAKIVGLTRFGDDPASNTAGDIFVAPEDVATYLSGGVEQFDSIYVSADPGQQAAVIGTLQELAGPNFVVLDNAQLREQEGGAGAAFANVLGYGLQGFAYLALGVCLLIVYNTFSIIVAQRVREFALLRALGADTKQIRRSVRREALLIGTVASATGLLIGIGLFLLLLRAVPAFKSLTGGGAVKLQVGLGTVLQVLLLGIAITFVSAVWPSFRAGRTKPIEALQAVSIDKSGVNRFRAVAGPILIAAGVGLLILGVAVGQFLIGVLGPFCLFAGVIIGGPRLAVWFSAAVGALVRPLARRVGDLAVSNVRRNPARTATTALALVIGVFLVVFVTAAGGAVRDYASDQLSQFAGPDLTVAVERGELPTGLTEQIEQVPGVTGVAPVYPVVGQASLGANGEQPVAAADFSQLDVLGYKADLGSTSNLRDDQVVVWSLLTQGSPDLQVGSPIVVTFPNGQTKQMTIGALVQPVFTVPPIVISDTVALAQSPNLQPQQLGVATEPGQVQAVQQSIENLVADYSTVAVLPGNIFGQLIKGIFNGLIQSVNALLGVAVLIALFGIVNTLILSVTERTREIGLLRAVGMTRSQLRAVIRIEAAIVALLGTAVGMIFGLFVAYTVTRPIFQDGTGSFNWPLREMVVIAVLGLVLGVLAALVPAWRASHLDVLEAITHE